MLELVLGLALLLIVVRQWRGRPRAGEHAEMPKWMKTIDTFTTATAAAFGVALSALNPKNLLLVVGAAAAIAQTGISTGKQAVALAVFVIIGAIGTGTPVVLHLAMGDRSAQTLESLKSWMSEHNGAIMAVLCLIIAAKLIGSAIGGFSL